MHTVILNKCGIYFCKETSSHFQEIVVVSIDTLYILIHSGFDNTNELLRLNGQYVVYVCVMLMVDLLVMLG